MSTTAVPGIQQQNYKDLWGLMSLGIVCLYILLSPFYVFGSGYPQPADMVMAAGCGAALLMALVQFRPEIDRVYLVAISFGVYTFIINMTHYIYFPDIRLLLSSMYYLYNVSVFIFVASVLRHRPGSSTRVVFSMIALAIIIQFFHTQFIASEHPFRETGSFNNPNQLAYWVLLASSVVLVLKYRMRLGLFEYLVLGLAFFMQLLALSKAGIITSVLLFLLCLVSPVMRPLHRVVAFVLLAFAVFAIGLYVTKGSSASRLADNAIEKSIERILSIGEEGDDSLEGRGYFRVVDNPEYLVLGAGEGAFWRYDRYGGNYELHSGLVTLVFAYGILGLGLFIYFLYSILAQRPLFVLAVMLIILLFGAVHQNIRFSLFWVFLGIIHGMPVVERTIKEEQG
jgi:hypothetical protein